MIRKLFGNQCNYQVPCDETSICIRVVVLVDDERLGKYAAHNGGAHYDFHFQNRDLLHGQPFSGNLI